MNNLTIVLILKVFMMLCLFAELSKMKCTAKSLITLLLASASIVAAYNLFV